jgi:hypothetical protein
MGVVIKDCSGPVDQGLIDSFEKKFSIKLPEEYRFFLKKYNGGYPEPDSFSFNDAADGSTVDRFLGLGVGEYSNLEKYLHTYRSRIPKRLFPIAHDPGGNLVLIGLFGPELNKIYFWDHELEAEESEPDMSNVYFLANDLDEFLNSLCKIDE